MSDPPQSSSSNGGQPGDHNGGESDKNWTVQKGLLRLKVTRRGYKRYHRMFLDDFVYEIDLSTVKEEGGTAKETPFLTSMMDLLKEGLESIIGRLQTIYKADGKHQQIFIAFVSSAIDNGFPTRNFELFSPTHGNEAQAEFIVNVTLQCLSELLRSASHIKVDKDNFTVLLTVLTKKHIRHLDRKNKDRKVLTYTGDAYVAATKMPKLSLRFLKRTRKNCLDLQGEVHILASCAAACLLYRTLKERYLAYQYDKSRTQYRSEAHHFKKYETLRDVTETKRNSATLISKTY